MDAGLLMARVVFGARFAAHGSQKRFHWLGGDGPDGTGRCFDGWGFGRRRRIWPPQELPALVAVCWTPEQIIIVPVLAALAAIGSLNRRCDPAATHVWVAGDPVSRVHNLRSRPRVSDAHAGSDGTLLARFHAGVADLPVVICRGTKVLRSPTNAQVAECIGFNEEIDHHRISDVLVAGPSSIRCCGRTHDEAFRRVPSLIRPQSRSDADDQTLDDGIDDTFAQ